MQIIKSTQFYMYAAKELIVACGSGKGRRYSAVKEPSQTGASSVPCQVKSYRCAQFFEGPMRCMAIVIYDWSSVLK